MFLALAFLTSSTGEISYSLLEPPFPLHYHHRLVYVATQKLGEDLRMAEVKTEQRQATAVDLLLIAELAPEAVMAFHPAVPFDLFRVYKP